MKEYHKIETVWERDPATKFRTLIDGKWATPEIAYLAGSDWIWTEKVDGTNIRIMWDGETVRFGGKTDAAQIFAPLIERLQQIFYAGALAKIFDGSACLYGEGYGAKIQKGGGNYLADGVDFALFDVRCGEVWLTRESVSDIAHRLRVQSVPVVGIGPLMDAISLARKGIRSTWGDFEAEGLVMRPSVELLDRRGHRIITKIKTRDFNREAQ